MKCLTQSQVSALLSLCPRIFVVSLWFCLLLYNFLAATVSNSKSVSCPVTTSHFTSQGSDKAHDEYQRVVLCPDGACLRAVHNQQGISCEVHHQLHHVPEVKAAISHNAAGVVPTAHFSKLSPNKLSRYLLSTAVLTYAKLLGYLNFAMSFIMWKLMMIASTIPSTSSQLTLSNVSLTTTVYCTCTVTRWDTPIKVPAHFSPEDCSKLNPPAVAAVANAALFSKLRPETPSHNFGINSQEPSDTGTRILDELTPLLPSTSMP